MTRMNGDTKGWGMKEIAAPKELGACLARLSGARLLWDEADAEVLRAILDNPDNIVKILLRRLLASLSPTLQLPSLENTT